MKVKKRTFPLWVKMAGATALVVAPLAATFTMLVKQSSYKIDFAQLELYGDEYLRPASRLLASLARYKSAIRAGAAGATPLTALEEQVENDLRALQAVQQKLAEPLKVTPAE